MAYQAQKNAQGQYLTPDGVVVTGQNGNTWSDANNRTWTLDASGNPQLGGSSSTGGSGGTPPPTVNYAPPPGGTPASTNSAGVYQAGKNAQGQFVAPDGTVLTSQNPDNTWSDAQGRKWTLDANGQNPHLAGSAAAPPPASGAGASGGGGNTGSTTYNYGSTSNSSTVTGVPGAPTSPTPSPRDPRLDALYGDLLSRSQESLNLTGDEPVIKAQTDAASAIANRTALQNMERAAVARGPYGT